MKNIIEALVKAQSEIDTIKKDRDNPIAKSKYATLDTILEEVLPKLNKYGLFLTQEPTMKDEENGQMYLGIKTTIWHQSGESLEYQPLYMPIEENKRMNISQQSGSVITYAKRYAVSAILGISTDEDKDGVQSKSVSEPITKENVKDMKMPFGKHKGKLLFELFDEDKQYLKWLYEQEKTDNEIKYAIKLIGKIKNDESEGVKDDSK